MNKDTEEKNIAEFKKSIQKLFQETTIKRMRDSTKTFKGLHGQTLTYAKRSDSIFSGIQKMKESGVGHLIITSDESSDTIIGVISKKDILVYMIKNFTVDSNIDVLLDEKMKNIDLGTTGKKVTIAKKDETLRRVFQDISKGRLSCIPIADDHGIYQGSVSKLHIELLMQDCSLYRVSKMV